MVTRTEKAYKNPRATMADGRLTGQARNISAPMRQGGVMRAAAESRRRKDIPPVPYTRPPVSTQQRAETAFTRGIQQAGPGKIADAALARVRGMGPAPAQAMTALPEVLSAPASEYAPMYMKSSAAPGSGQGGEEPADLPYEGSNAFMAAKAAMERGTQAVPTPSGDPEHTPPYPGAVPMLNEAGYHTGGWTTPEAYTNVPAPPAGAPHPKPIYSDIDGKIIGWSDADGNTYDAFGNLMATAPKSEDPWDDEAGMYESEKPKTTQDFIDEYLSDDSDAITPEEIFGELYGMDQAEAKAGADLASMMGGLGMGRSGQHMGAQTALSAQTFADKHKRLTDIQLANENLRAERDKNIIEMYWKEMDAEERKQMHDQLVGLQKDADKYSVAEWLLALTQEDKFSQKGLQEYFKLWGMGMSTDEIMAVLREKGYLSDDANPPTAGTPPDQSPGSLLGSEPKGAFWSDEDD